MSSTYTTFMITAAYRIGARKVIAETGASSAEIILATSYAGALVLAHRTGVAINTMLDADANTHPVVDEAVRALTVEQATRIQQLVDAEWPRIGEAGAAAAAHDRAAVEAEMKIVAA
ncbi:hypothetical protein [Tsukamurella pseudospumae]|uniref:Uncharacterized protein n=1 Tax=Tsukamurella pseudospumae TaxID=239498 RepID=A0A138AE00_9ACTN|nr:hypothetical protein [Tsukamurella pseudospumae]KXP08696.1 hypothetical protein AXK60_08460 [Tsukamurella pseudospumae]